MTNIVYILKARRLLCENYASHLLTWLYEAETDLVEQGACISKSSVEESLSSIFLSVICSESKTILRTPKENHHPPTESKLPLPDSRILNLCP